MTREGKLYFLEQKVEELIKLIDSNKNRFRLTKDIAIFQITQDQIIYPNYAIISVSEEVDRIVEQYGAVQLDEKNLLRNTLKLGNYKMVYGDDSVIPFLENVR